MRRVAAKMHRGVQLPKDRDRTHHISSIVHHFLEETEPRERALNNSDRPGAEVTAERYFTVAAASLSPLAAYATAGLGMASLPTDDVAVTSSPQVFLREWRDQRHSARSFLERVWRRTDSPPGSGELTENDKGGCPARAPVVQLVNPRSETNNTRNRGDVGNGYRCGDRERARVDDEYGDGRAVPARQQIHWLNLGRLTEPALRALEANHTWCEGTRCPLAGRDGLVWCLRVSEIESLHVAYVLGRLVSVCRPAQVQVLLFPDSRRSHDERSGEQAAVGVGEDTWTGGAMPLPRAFPAQRAASITRGRELLAAVTTDRRCSFVELAAPAASPGDRAMDTADLREQIGVFRRVVASLLAAEALAPGT